ncbi:uncharacterized protein LOC119616338 [Lucilia sericata]|uniref:uncharacterized protein LOC119616338 n=1 Tax=Lucilia sericata TaxID=13632 RepID=UPI0018A8526B|nr:uncharacterized protein LOC119616338 [Lucilia sericata]
MTSTTTFATPLTHKQQEQHLPLCKRRGGDGGRGSFRIKKCPQHLLAYSIISILVFLCWLPDFIVALKDVSVTIPQAVKRGSNAMLTCNYDMENDTLYSVKWYKGRREFYRYTPKENPAMKVFPSQSGLNVERNLSNQSHVVLLAVPLNISGKFTCEISVEAPSFQTAMVSGEMEVVELPEEQATVTGIQPRYRIGDLVDGNCSIKYSKPAANLTWTINGIVVPPHHIKTYQIEKYEETNLESVMSAVHFMVTTQHFIKGQMRLKCTASIFDIFKEEIESVIEEDRPRIMASGQSYPPDHGYGSHGDSDGYEHNESYLTYFSAPKSSASPTADFVLNNILKMFKHKALKISQHLNSLVDNITQNALTSTLVNKMKNSLDRINLINVLFLMLIKLISVFIILLVVLLLQIQQKNYLRKCLQKKMTVNRKIVDNCIEMLIKIKENFLAMNLWPYTCYIEEKEQRLENGNCYQDANNDDCQAKCGQRQQQQQQYQQNEHCLVSNQNVINEENSPKETNITKTQWSSKNKTVTAALTAIDGQQQMSQTHAFDTLFLTNAAILPPTAFTSSSSCSLASTSLSLSTTLGYSKTYTHDSFPLYTVDASKSNNAKYMSKDQTLLMTSTASVTAAAAAVAAIVVVATSNSTYEIPSAFAPSTATATSTSVRALVLELNLLQTSVLPLLVIVKEETSIPSSLSSSSSSNSFSSLSPTFSRNNYLMAFIGELLLHQC